MNPAHRLNAALATLAAALFAAILAVLFVGRGPEVPTATAAPAPTTLPATVTTTSEDATSTSTTTTVTEAPPDTLEPFVVPPTLDGDWAAIDGSTTAVFSGPVLQRFQARSETGVLTITEPGELAELPQPGQPVQVVLFLQNDVGPDSFGPVPVLATLSLGSDGLVLTAPLPSELSAGPELTHTLRPD